MQENQGVRLQTELKKNLLFNNRVACFGFQILAFKPKLQGIINLSVCQFVLYLPLWEQ